jgi:hypothetical protein
LQTSFDKPPDTLSGAYLVSIATGVKRWSPRTDHRIGSPMKLLRPAILSSAAIAVAMASTPAQADHSWSGYHWESSTTAVQIEVVDTVSGKWDAALDDALADWAASPVLLLTKSQGGGNRTDCKAAAGTIKVCNAAYGYTGWLGIATIWIRGGHITRSSTKLNDSYFNVIDYDTPEWRRFVTCQEIGHGFGLAHQDEDHRNANLGSCMDYTNQPETNQQPNAHDYEMLELIYDHLHEGDTSGSTGGGKGGKGKNRFSDGDDEVGNTPNGWGRPTDYDVHGKPNVFERNLGGGNIVLTHVYWLPEEGDHDHDH